MEHVTDLLESKTYQRFGYQVNKIGTDEGVYKIELDARKYRQERILTRLKARFPADEFDILPLSYRTTSDIANEYAKNREVAIEAKRAAARAAADQLIEDNA